MKINYSSYFAFDIKAIPNRRLHKHDNNSYFQTISDWTDLTTTLDENFLLRHTRHVIMRRIYMNRS